MNHTHAPSFIDDYYLQEKKEHITSTETQKKDKPKRIIKVVKKEKKSEENIPIEKIEKPTEGKEDLLSKKGEEALLKEEKEKDALIQPEKSGEKQELSQENSTILSKQEKEPSSGTRKPKKVVRVISTSIPKEKDSKKTQEVQKHMVDASKKEEKREDAGALAGKKDDQKKEEVKKQEGKQKGKKGEKHESQEMMEKKGKRQKMQEKIKIKERKFVDFLEEEETFVFSSKVRGEKQSKKSIKEKVFEEETICTHITIPEYVTIKELSEKTRIPVNKILIECMKNGLQVTVNSQIDFETAEIVLLPFHVECSKEVTFSLDIEEIALGNIQDILERERLLERSVERPPVVSVMGHVDHGKTSLLDYIRNTKVAEREAGGITQSIGAYKVEYNGRSITFLDTPGHEAFTLMRAKGAKSTDIAILVVAADEGVMEQTKESIQHAREAKIPIIVALSKIDKPTANVEKVKQQLSEIGLIPEEWGGDTPMVGVSARTGEGIDVLLEMILLLADIKNFRANLQRPVLATVLESHIDTRLGVVATVLIHTGVLKKGDFVVCKHAYGKVKIIKDFLGRSIEQAYPSDPVVLVGLHEVAETGDIIEGVFDLDTAKNKYLQYQEIIKRKKAAGTNVSGVSLFQVDDASKKVLKIVVKADTDGACEALKLLIQKLHTEEVGIQIVLSGIGNIKESDVIMAKASGAVLVGYNVEILPKARLLIDEFQIKVLLHNVIYHIVEDLETIVKGSVVKKEIEKTLCKARIAGIFYVTKDFTICGLQRISGDTIQKNAFVRIFRGNKYIGKGTIENLKLGSIDVKELQDFQECGIKLKTQEQIELGDVVEVYVKE